MKIKYLYKDHGDTCPCSFCVVRKEIVDVFKKEGYKYKLEKLDESSILDGVRLGCASIFVVKKKRFIIYLFENSLLPNKWVHYLNENFDYVICVSKYLERVFLNSGIKNSKLLYWPLGVDTNIFKPGKHKRVDDTFRLLNIGAITPECYPDRKGRDILIKCYRKVFHGMEDVVLIIKSDREIKGIDLEDPPIQFLTDVYTKESVADLYKTVALNGVYIATDRAEGFRMPALEAISSGCFTGMPNYSGNIDEIGKYVDLFECDEVGTNFYKEYYEDWERPMWGEPKEDKICQFMEFYYKNRRRVSNEVIKEVHKLYNWETLVKDLVQILRKG